MTLEVFHLTTAHPLIFSSCSTTHKTHSEMYTLSELQNKTPKEDLASKVEIYIRETA